MSRLGIMLTLAAIAIFASAEEALADCAKCVNVAPGVQECEEGRWGPTCNTFQAPCDPEDPQEECQWCEVTGTPEQCPPTFAAELLQRAWKTFVLADAAPFSTCKTPSVAFLANLNVPFQNPSGKAVAARRSRADLRRVG
jgi:hypothetical protein